MTVVSISTSSSEQPVGHEARSADHRTEPLALLAMAAEFGPSVLLLIANHGFGWADPRASALALVGFPVGAVLGLVALGRIRNSTSPRRGRRLAKVTVVLGFAVTGLVVLGFVVLWIALSNSEIGPMKDLDEFGLARAASVALAVGRDAVPRV